MSSAFWLRVWMVSVLAAVSCVEKNPAAVDQVQLADILRKDKPSPKHALDIRFGDRVRLFGYDLEYSPVLPDRPFKVTWYFQVDKALGPGFQIFTHGADDKNRSRLNLDGARLMRSVYPVEGWKAGDFIKDTQEITLPKSWGSSALTLYLGFYKGKERLPITAGAHDDESRAKALTIPVSLGPEPKPLARLVARRVTQPIVLDGKLDERDWKAAQPSGPLVNTMTGEKGSVPAEVKVAYDADNLYIGFTVEDENLISSHQNHDDHLWEQDCVEVMIDPDGDSKNYFELQVSPRGVSFDTRYDSPRSPRPFGDLAWSSQVNAKLVVDGTLDDDEDDEGYVVEMALPWTAFAVGKTPATPPGPDTTWRMNFFVMDSREKAQRAVGWSPPLIGDFHTLHRFGRVVFPVGASFAPDVVPVAPAAPANAAHAPK